ncbi:MAG: GWxTD domain-containing protein [candidate division Zixibacteria bacterium]|nr:GWxTD domain-containing protein [candidate division Zixibacteria bacterium]
MKKEFMTALLLVLLLVVSATAQLERPIRLWMDAASYAYLPDSSDSYVEICCAIQRVDIQFEEVADTTVAGGKLYVGWVYLYLEIRNRDGNMVDSLGKDRLVRVQYLEDAYKENVRFFDCLGTTLPPGNYQLKWTVYDMNTKTDSTVRSGIATRDLTVRDFQTDKLLLSDIELAYRIDPVASDAPPSPLVKGGHQVIPNPNGYYSNEDSLIYFYLEVYNLKVGEGKDNSFELTIRLLDRFGYELKEIPKVEHRKPGATAAICEGVSLAGLPGGQYLLKVIVKDKASGRKASVQKPLTLVYGFDQLTPSMTDPDVFTEEDAKLMEQVIYYISSKQEKRTYKELDLKAKKNFLASFWKDRNPNPGSKVNTYKDEIFRRFLYANYYYSTGVTTKNDGWRNDRGRVYITYGEPNEIERHPSSMDIKPYERWFYDHLPGQRGGDYFVFVDEDGYGNYRLIHSTLRGEISDPNWESRLGIMGN